MSGKDEGVIRQIRRFFEFIGRTSSASTSTSASSGKEGEKVIIKELVPTSFANVSLQIKAMISWSKDEEVMAFLLQNV